MEQICYTESLSGVLQGLGRASRGLQKNYLLPSSVVSCLSAVPSCSGAGSAPHLGLGTRGQNCQCFHSTCFRSSKHPWKRCLMGQLRACPQLRRVAVSQAPARQAPGLWGPSLLPGGGGRGRGGPPPPTASPTHPPLTFARAPPDLKNNLAARLFGGSGLKFNRDKNNSQE